MVKVFKFVLNCNLITEDCPPVIYPLTLSMAMAKFACPVTGCAGRAGTKYDLRRHYRILHPQDLVDVPGKGCCSRCDCWGTQVNPIATCHKGTNAYKAMHAAKLQREEVSNSVTVLRHKFLAY